MFEYYLFCSFFCGGERPSVSSDISLFYLRQECTLAFCQVLFVSTHVRLPRYLWKAVIPYNPLTVIVKCIYRPVFLGPGLHRWLFKRSLFDQVRVLRSRVGIQEVNVGGNSNCRWFQWIKKLLQAAFLCFIINVPLYNCTRLGDKLWDWMLNSAIITYFVKQTYCVDQD